MNGMINISQVEIDISHGLVNDRFSKIFWSIVDYIYYNRLTSFEFIRSCSEGGIQGSPGGPVGIGVGCGRKFVKDAFLKLWDGSGGPPIQSETGEGIDSCPNYEEINTCPYYEGSDYCPAPENNSCFDPGNNSCPISDFDGFGSNSDSWPTVSSGWGSPGGF
tara:strand:+ start:1228 stop:1713 length:486 start_codon:yes stop_codon:yes gene_type:complete